MKKLLNNLNTFLGTIHKKSCRYLRNLWSNIKSKSKNKSFRLYLFFRNLPLYTIIQPDVGVVFKWLYLRKYDKLDNNPIPSNKGLVIIPAKYRMKGKIYFQSFLIMEFADVYRMSKMLMSLRPCTIGPKPPSELWSFLHEETQKFPYTINESKFGVEVNSSFFLNEKNPKMFSISLCALARKLNVLHLNLFAFCDYIDVYDIKISPPTEEVLKHLEVLDLANFFVYQEDLLTLIEYLSQPEFAWNPLIEEFQEKLKIILPSLPLAPFFNTWENIKMITFLMLPIFLNFIKRNYPYSIYYLISKKNLKWHGVSLKTIMQFFWISLFSYLIVNPRVFLCMFALKEVKTPLTSKVKSHLSLIAATAQSTLLQSEKKKRALCGLFLHYSRSADYWTFKKISDSIVKTIMQMILCIWLYNVI
jgi:hypothetical protein